MLNQKERLRNIVKIAGTSYVSIPKEIIKKYKIRNIVQIVERKTDFILKVIR